ncbi:MAG: c-type cytochrome, partial [Marinobacterium sp.]
LCGKDHGFMPVVIEAVSQSDFDQWLADAQTEKQRAAAAADRTWTLDELMQQGEQVYLRVCAACHLPTGEGVPGAFPALKGSPVVIGDVAGHIDIVLNGKSGTAMQAFRDQLSATELAAVITYERNAWGNSLGEAVSPAQVARLLEPATGEAEQ